MNKWRWFLCPWAKNKLLSCFLIGFYGYLLLIWHHKITTGSQTDRKDHSSHECSDLSTSSQCSPFTGEKKLTEVRFEWCSEESPEWLSAGEAAYLHVGVMMAMWARDWEETIASTSSVRMFCVRQSYLFCACVYAKNSAETHSTQRWVDINQWQDSSWRHIRHIIK